MKKEIAVFTISEQVGSFYKEQLYDLFGERICVSTFSVEKGGSYNNIAADLYLVATTSSDTFDYVMSFIPEGAKVVVSNITFRKESLMELAVFPKGTKALLVNLSVNMAIETISDLNRFGITNIEFYPCYPGMKKFPDTGLAITPGERRYVPKGINRIIDIGHRVFTANTVLEIALKLDFTEFIESEKYRDYIQSLAEVDYSTNTLASKSYSMENKFEILLEAVDEGIIGVDGEGTIFAFNRLAGRILMMEQSWAVGRRADEILPFFKDIILKRACAEPETNLVKIKGVYLNVTTAPIIRDKQYMGIFLLIQRFSDEENKQHKMRTQMMGRGCNAKYTFDDIIGESPEMLKAKNIAGRMAQADGAILLTGESGTGKELFAHAIHMSSARRNMPFVAVNCAALPDSLLESELFGYGDGAFTGAKKGGRIGLFEYAHMGTVFLDEIEGMSPNLQVKLLRVLQEKEVMRIGENKIINIDVRIIAASNENIRKMVDMGMFRQDLYYRINTFPIDIPPLRERGNDVFMIMEEIKRKCGAHFKLSEEAAEAFLQYSWDGNVRELQNIVEYLKFTDLDTVGYSDLPEALKEGRHRNLRTVSVHGTENKKGEIKKDLVLEILLESERKGVHAGRKTIAAASYEKGFPLSEQQVRGIMKELENEGLIIIAKGRAGTKLTEKGKKYKGYI